MVASAGFLIEEYGQGARCLHGRWPDKGKSSAVARWTRLMPPAYAPYVTRHGLRIYSYGQAFVRPVLLGSCLYGQVSIHSQVVRYPFILSW